LNLQPQYTSGTKIIHQKIFGGIFAHPAWGNTFRY